MSNSHKPMMRASKGSARASRAYERQVTFRVSAADYTALEEAAKKEKLTVAEYSRRAVWMRMAGKQASDMIAEAIEIERRDLRAEREAIKLLADLGERLGERIEAVDGQVQAVRNGLNQKLIPYLDTRFGTLQKALSLSGYLHTAEEQG